MLYYGKACKKALEASDGERHMLAFLKSAPYLLIKVFNTGNNAQLLCPEFRFGNRMRADFCILSGHSGGWEVHLIELEPVGAGFFLKDGTESLALRKAKRQVSDWHHYIQAHQMDFREELAQSIISRNIWQPELNRLHEHHRPEIISQRFSFRCDYYIVLGRRGALKEEDVERRSHYHEFNRCELVTYDRILDAAIDADRTVKESMKWRREQRKRYGA